MLKVIINNSRNHTLTNIRTICWNILKRGSTSLGSPTSRDSPLTWICSIPQSLTKGFSARFSATRALLTFSSTISITWPWHPTLTKTIVMTLPTTFSLSGILLPLLENLPPRPIWTLSRRVTTRPDRLVWTRDKRSCLISVRTSLRIKIIMKVIEQEKVLSCSKIIIIILAPGTKRARKWRI